MSRDPVWNVHFATRWPDPSAWLLLYIDHFIRAQGCLIKHGVSAISRESPEQGDDQGWTRALIDRWVSTAERDRTNLTPISPYLPSFRYHAPSELLFA